MFTHWVLFGIRKKDVPVYKVDCRIWAREARRHAGFLGCHTLMRTDHRGQYASCYLWKSERHHRHFMDKHHDRLVSLSKCPVKVIGYFNFKTL